MLASLIILASFLPSFLAASAFDIFYHEGKTYQSEDLAPLVYMQISDDTYNPTCEICKTGFMQYDFQELLVRADDNGFFGRTYMVTNKDTDYSQVVISFRGSDDISDFVQDVLLFFGTQTEQFHSSELYFQEAFSKYSSHYEISLTGHSLGGCFAYVESRKTDNLAVLFDAPGCERFMPEGNWSQECPLITQYVKNPNFINNLGQSCGETFRIAPCSAVDNFKWVNFWRDNSYSIHLAMVVGSFMHVNPIVFLIKSAVIFLIEREVESIVQGHLLMSYPDLFDKKTGAPVLFEKVAPDSWSSYFNGYSCMLKAEKIEKTQNKQEQVEKTEFTLDPFFSTPNIEVSDMYSDESNDYYEGFSYEFDWYLQDFPLLSVLIILHSIQAAIPKLKIRHTRNMKKQVLPPIDWFCPFENTEDADDDISIFQKFKLFAITITNRVLSLFLGEKPNRKIKDSGRFVKETLKISLI